jgi:diaminohydroxyphosphoribosylaminopyrimidine deaminase / 5-amino-6-(5-phosphoribosylamino)uracil reductase
VQQWPTSKTIPIARFRRGVCSARIRRFHPSEICLLECGFALPLPCMSNHTADEQFLRRALDLAREGIGLASPNPYVGAVIADVRGSIVGTGAYKYESLRHAEILALEQAGNMARGGTLYINLEPHAHQGRTPPCTDALIGAGIHRVVASMPDPNPRVSGRGFEKLRAAGIQLEVGGLHKEAQRLNEAFARYIRDGIPLVTLKAAMTLDGKIGARLQTGSGRTAGVPPGGWITGEAARAHVHEQRHASDAILVGVGTVLVDDPLLSDRSGKPRRRPLLRVILDSHLRLPLESRIVTSVSDREGSGDVLVFYSSADEKKISELQARGVRVEQVVADAEGRPDMKAVLRRLGELEITSLMIEGGSTVNGIALDCGVVDKVFLYYAPEILGANSIPFAGFGETTPTLKVRDVQLYHFGEDFAVEGYLRDPYEE